LPLGVFAFVNEKGRNMAPWPSNSSKFFHAALKRKKII